MSNNDSVLIERVISGEDAAFDELYRKYVRLVYYIAYKNTWNDADAKDIVQETFLEVKRTIHTLQNPDAFKFWLNRITLSKCRNLFRKNRYANRNQETLASEHEKTEERDYLLPHKSARKNSDAMVLTYFINELPQGQREVLILYYLEQFHIEEISQLLDIPQGTVKSRLSYARENLKQKIERYEQKEGIKLNFHSLAEGIVLAMTYELSHMTIPTSLTFNRMKTKSSSAASAWTTSAITKITAICLSSFFIAGGGILAYQHYQDAIQSNKQEEEKSVLTDKTDRKGEVFPGIYVKDKHITTSQSAYFHLKLWACCEEEMNVMTKEEFIAIKPLYEQLKQLDNNYYHSLVDSGWSASFEKLYTKFKK